MPAYGAPGAGASDAVENFLLRQQQQRHMQLMDQIALASEKRIAEREMREAQWKAEDREKVTTEKEIASQIIGDPYNQELALRAAKHHLPYKKAQGQPLAGQQFMEGMPAPDMATGGPIPGTYAGSQGQQFGVRLGRGEFTTPQEAVGAAMEAGQPVPEQKVLESIFRPKAGPKWTPGTTSGADLPEGTTDIFGNAVKETKHYKVAPDPTAPGSYVYAPVESRAEEKVPLLWSPDRRSFYRVLGPGQVEPWTGDIPKGAKISYDPTPPTSQKINTDEGWVEYQPHRGPTRQPPTAGAPVGVRPPATSMAPPQAAGAPAAVPTATPQHPVTAGGSTVRSITGPGGKPVYGPSGPPLTEAGAAPFAVMLAAGISPTTLMSMGMAGSMRTKVANLSAEYRTGQKAIPPELVGFVSKVADKATTIQTLKFLQKQQATASTSANIAKENLQLALDAGEKVARTDALFINKMVNRALRDAGIDVTGSSDTGKLSDFETKIYTAIREYAKVASGSSGSVAGLSDGATREATALLNSAQSPKAFKAAVDAMIADMDNIIGGWQKGYQDMIDSLDDTKKKRSAKEIVDSILRK